MATLEKLCTLSNNENDSSDASTENTNKFNKTRKSKQTNKKCAHQNLKNISTQTKNARKLNELTGNNEATAIDVNDFSRDEIERSNTTQLYDDLSIKIKKCVTMSTSDDQCNSLNSQYAANMKYQQLNNQYDINNTPEHCHRMNENLECNNDFIKQNSDSDERYKLFVTGSIIFLFCYNLVISYYLLGVLNIPKSISNSRSDLENIFNTVEFKMAIERLTKEPVQFDLNRRKRGALTLDDNAVGGGSMSNGPTRRKALQVEGPSKDYFGLRDEAVEKEAEWFWLSGTSRVPKKDIVTFCHESRDFCLPSMKGSPGPSGERGDRGPRGERGETGLPGQIGPPGPTGPRGPPGEVGWPGAPGLDGRDGVPGEPGLDGVPGRSGTDGLPGLDGIPGKDGLSGKDGKDGINGLNGKTGPQGPPGPMGSRGLTGPRGRLGKAGTNGTPGVPGITAWIHGGINGSKDLLIPPSIAGSAAVKPIVVHEGENLRMRCAATGQPRPLVEWRKVDGSIIPLGSWQAVSVQGHTLNLTRINRAHMGEYMCVADNGVPPAANQTFNVEVHFPPMIRIRKQMVGAANGTTATLECEVEAFPEAVRYWERADGRLLESSGYGDGGKYRVDLPDSPPGTPTYRSQMRLNVTRISPHDYTLYHCIAKNEMGVTRGVFTLYEIDPRLAKTYKTGTDSPEGGVAVYGERPPERVTLEDLCPPSPQCRECPVGPGGIALGPGPATCRSDTAVSLYDLVGGRLDVRTLVPEGHLAGAPLHSASYTGLPNRTLDCVLYAVGKPVYHRFTDLTYGSWMRDAAPKNDAAGERLWVTREDETRFLYEFANKTAFRKDMYTKRYTLVHPFKGNAHVIYNGSFFYNSRDKPARVLRFNLDTEYVSLDLPVAGTNVTTAVPLYTNEYNLMDFSVDDNGLWVIYGLPGSNNTAVAKIDTNAMKVQHAWNASVNHKRVGDMFVACGVLYAVDSTIERNTRVRLALDLYKSLLLEVNLAFTNPFRRTTMLGYNPRNKELYSWDKGNQLTYPVRYHEIGYNQTFEDRQQEPYAQMQTGHEVYT